MNKSSEQEPESEPIHMLCPDCGKKWGDNAPPDVSLSDACWIALRLLVVMGDGYASGTEEEKAAIKLVGEMLWHHMLDGAERDSQ